MPNRHLIVFDQERTYHLIKNQEQKIPEDRSRRAYPVFAGTFRRENIDRWAILRMHWKRAINPTQVRQKIVQVGIVQLCKRTHLGVINVDGNPSPLDFGFDVIGDIMSAETVIFDREPAKRTNQI